MLLQAVCRDSSIQRIGKANELPRHDVGWDEDPSTLSQPQGVSMGRFPSENDFAKTLSRKVEMDQASYETAIYTGLQFNLQPPD